MRRSAAPLGVCLAIVTLGGIFMRMPWWSILALFVPALFLFGPSLRSYARFILALDDSIDYFFDRYRNLKGHERLRLEQEP